MLRRDSSATATDDPLLMMDMLHHLLALAFRAGEGILTAQKEGLRVSTKADASMVTHADEEADMMIVAELQRLAPDVPVVSEEGASLPEETIKHGRFWLVDPLDGTNGFIRGGSEYTVNIALIEDQLPVMGIIVIPATGEGFAAIVGKGAWKQQAGQTHPIKVRSAPAEGWTVLLSHRGAHERARALLADYPVAHLRPASSSLKFCRIAEGGAEVYPRLGPTMEWDTAAGHAILKAAGGEVYALPSGESFRYGRHGFRNGNFIAVGGVELDAARLPYPATL
jgi:3'(2'), 5'-bisphosphate nucleotidase